MEDRFRFRVWNKDNKAMYDCEQLTPWALDPAQDQLKGVFIPFRDGYKIMQCTGLKDKNGKFIYEGDVVDDLKKDSFHDKEFIMSFAGCSDYKEGTGKKVVYKCCYTAASFALDPFERGNMKAPLIGFEEFLVSFNNYDTIHDKFSEPYTKINVEVIGNIYENPELLEVNNGQ